ncbi:MAG: trypsin-like serine protease, partial [Myxococcota bacterium]
MAVASCAPGAEGDQVVVVSASSAIKGGIEEPNDPSIVSLLSQGGGLCSGTLIAPNAVLTARHCVSPVQGENNGAIDCAATRFAAPFAGGALAVDTRAQVDLSGRGGARAELVVPLSGRPGIPAFTDDDALFCGNDLAVVLLREVVPPEVATPREPRFEPLEPGAPYTAVGFGGEANNEAETTAGIRRRRDDLQVQCIGADCVEAVEFVDDGDVTADEWVGNGGVCQGDSGGPALDVEGRVIGGASRGTIDCENTIYANVAPN